MTKYIEDYVNDDLMYSKTNYLYSFNCRITMRIGTRGIGKTYDAKKKCLKLWLQKSKQFIWVRATEEACGEMLVESGAKFFDDLGDEYKKREKYYIRGSKVYVDNTVIGTIMALSTFYKKKGNAYPNVDLIVFDEVIPERVERRYFDRVNALINTCETIARTRPNAKLLLLANALDKGDEILAHFKVKINKFGYYLNRDMSFICHYERPTLTYQRAHAKGLAGLLAKNSEYEDNILGNEFADKTEYFDKRPNTAKLIYIIHDINDAGARLYVNSDGLLYVCNDFNRVACVNIRYTNVLNNISPDRQYLPKPMQDQLIKAYTSGRVRFMSAKVKNIFLSYAT